MRYILLFWRFIFYVFVKTFHPTLVLRWVSQKLFLSNLCIWQSIIWQTKVAALHNYHYYVVTSAYHCTIKGTSNAYLKVCAICVTINESKNHFVQISYKVMDMSQEKCTVVGVLRNVARKVMQCFLTQKKKFSRFPLKYHFSICSYIYV